MKIVKNILTGIGCLIVVSLLATFVVLAVTPDIRRQAFTYAVPVFNLYQTMYVRRYVRERDFVAAANRLNEHIDLSKQLSPDRSKMLLGLVEAFDLVVGQARFETEFMALQKPLERLVAMEPDLFLGRIWLARALWYNSPKEAIKHLNIAIHLVSADEKSYRQGIDTALKLKQPSIARKYCEAYQTAQFGGSKPQGYHHIFRGLGLRQLGLLIKGENGEEVFLTNSGLQLNERRSYSFSLPHVKSLNMIELHSGTLPGLEVVVHDITLSKSFGLMQIQPQDLHVTSRAAYVLDGKGHDIRLITTHDNDEYFRFWLPEKQLDVERVTIDMTIRRLKLASDEVCRMELN
ncbi:hypothetical protein OAV67_01190 [Alphaproteobacteria bacterium]|nr:hypothetical protein [Alphaproteobacteria bacterium]